MAAIAEYSGFLRSCHSVWYQLMLPSVSSSCRALIRPLVSELVEFTVCSYMLSSICKSSNSGIVCIYLVAKDFTAIASISYLCGQNSIIGVYLPDATIVIIWICVFDLPVIGLHVSHTSEETVVIFKDTSRLKTKQRTLSLNL